LEKVVLKKIMNIFLCIGTLKFKIKIEKRKKCYNVMKGRQTKKKQKIRFNGMAY
jgi:hypothetical protein